jgi:2-oxoglutarate ferredoxin oxidoreductase subunit gamma
MEREVLITGIGGQGVQLAAQVLARAATLEAREVMYLGLYGGMMRGGNTDSTVVVADGPIAAPPVVSRAWAAIALHDDYWPPVEAKLRPGGLVLVNDTTFTSDIRSDVTVHRVPATTVATDLGNPLGGSMVMLAAFCATTGIVGENALVEGMRASIPPYRTQHIEANERAIRAGWELLPVGEFPAWEVPAHA